MSSLTKNLGLIKPEGVDRYNPDVFNKNLAVIDERLGRGGINLPVNQFNSVTGTPLNDFIRSSGSDVTITSAAIMLKNRAAHFRCRFTLAYPLETSAGGGLTNAPHDIGTINVKYLPMCDWGMGSLITWGHPVGGDLNATSGIVRLTHLMEQDASRNGVPAGTILELCTSWYVLKASI